MLKSRFKFSNHIRNNPKMFLIAAILFNVIFVGSIFIANLVIQKAVQKADEFSQEEKSEPLDSLSLEDLLEDLGISDLEAFNKETDELIARVDRNLAEMDAEYERIARPIDKYLMEHYIGIKDFVSREELMKDPEYRRLYFEQHGIDPESYDRSWGLLEALETEGQ